jgi:hypothetical protein
VSDRVPRGWRFALAVCCLAAVAVSEVRSLRLEDVSRRVLIAARQIGGERVPRAQSTGFYFDPGYAEFLNEVARRTPREATVAVLAPSRPDLYRYQAVFALAPRRVVEAAQISQARYVAVYGPEQERWPGGQPLPNGTLHVR